MKTIILCGGQGTRLREETEFRPKPLVEVGGRPVLWHIMKSYSHYGFNKFVLCLGYRGNMIKDYFLNYDAMNNDFTIGLDGRRKVEFLGEHEEQDFQVTLADTGQETMTGGRIRRIKRYVGDDTTFLVTYGDGLADVDVRKLVNFHRSHGKLATVTAVRPTSRFGLLGLDDESKVTQFAEKPTADGYASAGYFVFDRRIFNYLGTSDDCILEREPLENLSAEGELVAYCHEGFFFAMDTYRECKMLNELWEKDQAPWAVWKKEGGRGGYQLAG